MIVYLVDKTKSGTRCSFQLFGCLYKDLTLFCGIQKNSLILALEKQFHPFISVSLALAHRMRGTSQLTI
jgi:hypothetical protein